MNLLKTLRRIPEFLLVCLGYVCIPFLPRRAVVGLANGLGSLTMRLAGGMRRVGLANLDLAYGDTLSRQEKQAIVRQSFRVFARLILDLFWFGFRTTSRLKRWVRFGPDTDEHIKLQPVLVVTAHFGNWEVMGQAVALRGFPLVSVAAPLDGSFVDSLLSRARSRTGQQVAAKQGAVAALREVLREGRSTALLTDQNTLPRDGGAFVPFFGLPVPVSKAPAVLAKRTRVPTVFAYCVAEDDGSFTVESRLPECPARGGAAAWTRVVTRTLEEVVREHPGQWLWMYKRWKYIPDDRQPDAYPFYSRRPRETRLRLAAEISER